jgi:hypothetical protein
MNRTTVRVVSIVLAAGITISEFVGIALLAEHAGFTGDSVVVLPRITINATGMQEEEHLGVTRTPSVIASTAPTQAVQAQAAHSYERQP